MEKNLFAAKYGSHRIRPGSSHDFARIALQKPSEGNERS